MNNWLFLILIGSVAMLMYGMKVMSEGLQKMAGSKLRHVLGAMTTNRFTGLLTGAFITMSIQSSTACTVMTVSFVSAGLLTLAQAISVIMGANIGTTATAWIMVLGGSTSYMRYAVFTAIALGMGLIYSNKQRNMGEFIMGLALMLLGLTTLSANANDMHLDQQPAIMRFIGSMSGMGYGSYFLFLIIGSILTMAVQSSAAIMAITMTLCSTGVLPVDMGIALVMGENIGTTVTSNVVALSASTQARRAAMAHMVFNIFGVIWVLCLFRQFLSLVYSIVGYDPTAGIVSPAKLTMVLAAFHTSFNVCNTLILIWFVKPMQALVCSIIRQPQGVEGEEEEGRLKFIGGGLLSTAELSIYEAKKEICVFGDRCQKMYTLVQELLHTEKAEDFSKLFSRIEKYESITDNMEVEIAEYLNKVSEGRLSAESKSDIQHMLRLVSELESIGDSCYNMARTLNRLRASGTDFTAAQYECIHNMMALDLAALAQMNVVVKYGEERYVDLNKSYNLEHEINNYRNQLKNQNVLDVGNRLYDYQLSVHYMDLIAECEKLGDYVINVIEATGIREKKLSGF